MRHTVTNDTKLAVEAWINETMRYRAKRASVIRGLRADFPRRCANAMAHAMFRNDPLPSISARYMKRAICKFRQNITEACYPERIVYWKMREAHAASVCNYLTLACN